MIHLYLRLYSLQKPTFSSPSKPHSTLPFNLYHPTLFSPPSNLKPHPSPFQSPLRQPDPFFLCLIHLLPRVRCNSAHYVFVFISVMHFPNHTAGSGQLQTKGTRVWFSLPGKKKRHTYIWKFCSVLLFVEKFCCKCGINSGNSLLLLLFLMFVLLFLFLLLVFTCGFIYFYCCCFY